MDLRHSLQRLEWHLWHHWREQAKHNGHLELTNSELQYIYTLLAYAEQGIRLTELADQMKVSKASASAMSISCKNKVISFVNLAWRMREHSVCCRVKKCWPCKNMKQRCITPPLCTFNRH